MFVHPVAQLSDVESERFPRQLVGAHDAKFAVQHGDVTWDALEQDLVLPIELFAPGDVGGHGEHVGDPIVLVGDWDEAGDEVPVVPHLIKPTFG
jgi:hypothetical protein